MTPTSNIFALKEATEKALRALCIRCTTGGDQITPAGSTWRRAPAQDSVDGHLPLNAYGMWPHRALPLLRPSLASWRCS